ncbi:MAG: CmcI family methyltransferase [Cyanobacteria bacterium P01_B01_bin.77]
MNMSKGQNILGYQSLSKNRPHRRELSRADRFVSIDTRDSRGDIPTPMWATLIDAGYKQHWRDLHIQKSAMEMVLYPMILHELQPKTIIEIGAFNGGSAVWLADHLQILELNESHVYSMDIDLSFLDDRAKNDSRITFIEGDSNKIELAFPPKLLADLPHPWFFMEDSHHNLIGVLEHFHQHGLQDGDYLIVEDTNLYCWEYWNKIFKEEDNGDHKEQKGVCAREFIEKYKDEYLVDTYYQDLFGYNGSKSWNSILKRIG